MNAGSKHVRSAVTRMISLLTGAVLGAVLSVSVALAAESDEPCMICHTNSSLARSADHSSVAIAPAELGGSVHAELPCDGCHTDASPIPHGESLSAVRCVSCHDEQATALESGAHLDIAPTADAGCVSCHGSHEVESSEDLGLSICQSCHPGEVEEYQQSLHGKALTNGDPEASTCRDCHGSAHSILRHTDPQAPTHYTHLAETCAQCHADRELVIRRKITIPEAYTLYQKSVHGRSEEEGAAACNDCHESHLLLRASDPRSSIHHNNIAETCGKCHEQEEEDYRESSHGVALSRGVFASPTCTGCHGEHLIRGPNDPDSPVGMPGVIRTCSHCHEAEGIRETYGLPSGRLSTYRDSYHGLAARGGSPVVANCASCHEHHKILPASDPRSAVYPANLPVTCGQCHPGAGEKFAKGMVHVAMTAPAHPVLLYMRWIYITLIVATIGGMLIHNGLDFVSKLSRSLRNHLGTVGSMSHQTAVAAAKWYLRMSLIERVQHGLLALSFFVLVYTGFALTYSESWLFSWLARLEEGYAWRSHCHRWAAVIMVSVSLFHVGYLVSRRGRSLLVDLLPRPKDVRDAVANILYLIGLRSTPPKFERFGYIEKAEYWALIWGTVVMTVTGLLLWFENQSLQFLEKWVLDLATLVHFYEAWLAFLAIVVWHIYYVIVNPDVYPMNWTWLTGRISEEQMRHEHAAQWERIQVQEREEERKRELEEKLKSEQNRTEPDGSEDPGN